jgi:hypothetical protein
MTKTAKEVAYFLNTRPLCFLSTVFALRDMLIGIGLLFAVPDIARTLLYRNLGELGGAWIYGLLLVIISIVQGLTALSNNTRLTRWSLEFSAWFWLFAVCTYAVNGNWILAGIYIFMCSFPSGYIGWYYKWTSIWDGHKRRWRVRHGLDTRASLL